MANLRKTGTTQILVGALDEKMLTIAEMRSDVMGRFHNALYLGDVPERVKLLTEAGQLPLAYVCANIHGLTEQAEASCSAAMVAIGASDSACSHFFFLSGPTPARQTRRHTERPPAALVRCRYGARWKK